MSRYFIDHSPSGSSRVPLTARRRRVEAALAYWRGIAGETGDLVEDIWISKDERTFVGAIRCASDGQVIHHLDDGSVLIGGQNAAIEDRFARPTEVAMALKSEMASGLGDFDGGWTVVLIETDGRLSAARDRLGQKPLYAARIDDGRLLLASNAGAIVRSGWIAADANPDFLARYAAYNYLGTYGDRPTAFKGIDLLDVTFLHRWDRDGYRKKQYWNLDPAAGRIVASDAEFEARYRHLLIETMRRVVQPRAAERLTVALSGGIDSGSIAGLLHHVTGAPVEAVSVTYRESTDFDESELISHSVRDHVDKWHVVSIDDKVLLEDLPQLYERFDIPLATVSIYGYDYLYREASRRGMSTFLTGKGADQIQAGNYPYYLYHLADMKIGDPDLYEMELTCWIAHHGTPQFPKNRGTAEEFFKKALDLHVPGMLRPYRHFLSGDVLSPDFASSAARLEGRTAPNYGDYSRTYMVQDYLYEGFPSSVETSDLIGWTRGTAVIAPFMTRDIVEFGWRLPLDQRVRRAINKNLARRALRGFCADEILDRVAKSGFNAPFDLWVRGPIRDFAMDIFSSQAFRQRGVYDTKRFDRLLDSHMRGEENHMRLLWQALNLELWTRSWVDGRQ